MVKEDLAKVELYGCMAALRDVRGKCIKMNDTIVKVHSSLQRVLEEMCAVIHRQYSNMCPPAVPEAEYDASTLRPEAEKALIEMCKWFGEGSLPHISEMGVLNVSTGTGKITVLGDEVVGSGTAFRTEVQAENIILLEPVVFQKSGDTTKKSFALAVTAVLSQTRLKIASFVAEAVADHVTFVIAKGSKAKAPETLGFMNNAAVVPKQSPRSAQHLFEWDLQTQRMDMIQLREAEAQNQQLQRLKKQVDFELLTVLERPLVRMCFQAWRSQVKIRKKTVSLLW